MIRKNKLGRAVIVQHEALTVIVWAIPGLSKRKEPNVFAKVFGSDGMTEEELGRLLQVRRAHHGWMRLARETEAKVELVVDPYGDEMKVKIFGPTGLSAVTSEADIPKLLRRYGNLTLTSSP